jgi:simple sugar transport system permease protein
MNRIVRTLGLPLLAIVAAFVLGGVIVLLIGDDPIETYRLLLGSAVSWPDGIGYTLFYATPLIFTGLAVALALHAGLLNIGAEGQLYVGAFAAAWVAIAFANASPWILIPAAMLGAMVAGGVWGGVPGVLRAKFGAHEVITTIMMNFIGVALTNWLTQYYFKEPGDAIMQTGPIGANAHIARLGSFIPGLPERIPLNVSFLLALAACLAAGIFLWKTKWGYAMRASGANPAAAEYGGIATGRQIILAMTLSGALAGMVGIGEVLGYRYRFYDGFSPGYGFTGIAVALLARRHPGGVILAALLFGALIRGGLFVDIFTEEVSKDLVLVLQAIIILFVASGSAFKLSFGKSPRTEGKV